MNTERINPLIDVAFKMVFEDQNLLKSFLNSFLDFEIKELSVSSQVKLSKEMLDSKQSFLDLKAITDTGKLINIEVQLGNNKHFIKRSIFYTSKLITQNLIIGDNYDLVPKVIAINILDFKLLNHWHFFGHYTTFDSIHKDKLESGPEYYFIEMPKINQKDLDIQNTPFYRWLLFLKPDIHNELYKEVLKLDKDIEKAEEKLTHIQNNPELRERYEARFKNITDEANRLYTAREEGIEEGRKEGTTEERKTVVKRLIQQGKTHEEIESLLGYDPKKYL